MRSRIGYGVLGLAVAFLLATNPVVADAAKQITGAQIANNTITGQDVKESTLKKVPKAKDSKKLAGKAATSYLNQSYRYRLPAGAPAGSKTFSFPGLPAGSYLVTYAAAIQAGAIVSCVLSPDSPNYSTGAEGVSFSTSSATSFTNNGSTVLAVAAGNTAGLRCQSGANFNIYGGADAQSSVTFTRLDSIVDQGLSPVVRSAKPGKKGFAG